MSKDEASDKTLRELVRQSLTEIEQHRKDSEEYRNSTSVLLAKIIVHGEYTKETVRKCLEYALEVRRRIKEQLKKIGGMDLDGNICGEEKILYIHLDMKLW